MGAAKSRNSTKPIGPRFTDAELRKLDKQCAQLGGVSRAGAVKLMWANMGDEALARIRRAKATEDRIADGAVAKSVGHLTEALGPLDDAFNRYTHQRRAIGVHTNQIAKLANALSCSDEVDPEIVESMAYALEGVRDELAQQAAIEEADDRLRHEVRRLASRCLR